MSHVFITIDILDAEKTDISLTDEGKLAFSAESHGQKYGFDMELFNGINKAESGWNLKGRNVSFRLAKKDDDQEEYWPRLFKDKTKNQKVTIDWSKWVDEDEQDEAPEMPQEDGMQGFGGQGGMPGMGGAGGAGGMDMAAMQQMMAGMGGAGGAGGAGGMDMASMMAGMGGAGGPGGAGGMDMAAMQKMMAGMGGAGGMGGPDSDDEDEDE
jgi:hypothetical protein